MQADRRLARKMPKVFLSPCGLRRQRERDLTRRYAGRNRASPNGYGKPCWRRLTTIKRLHSSKTWMRGVSDSESAIVRNAGLRVSLRTLNDWELAHILRMSKKIISCLFDFQSCRAAYPIDRRYTSLQILA